MGGYGQLRERGRIGPGAATVALVGLASALVFFVGLERESYNGDESQWIVQGDRAWRLAVAGNWNDAFWNEPALLFGSTSPPISKFLIGIGMSAAGETSEGIPTVLARPNHRLDQDVLWAGRASSAVLGAIGVTAFFLLALRILSVRAAVAAALALALSPVWTVHARRAMTDIHGAALAITALYLLVVSRDLAIRRAPRAAVLGAFAATGLVLGLAVGSKFSAGGFAVGAALVLLVDLARSGGSSDPARTRSRLVLAGGVLVIAGALLTFWGPYVHLHEDGGNRLLGILQKWEQARGVQVQNHVGAFANAYPPGWTSFTEILNLLVFPGRWASALLGLPALFVLGTWLVPRLRTSSARTWIIVWILFLPAALAAVWDPGRLVHLWVVWAGFAGGGLGILARPASGERRGRANPAALAVACVTLCALICIAATTPVSWPRYYLLLLPGITLVAFHGLQQLQASLEETCPEAGIRLWAVPVGVGLALLCTLGEYPEYGHAKMVRALDAGWGRPSTWLLAAGLAAFSLFPTALAAPGRRRLGASRRPPPSGTPA